MKKIILAAVAAFALASCTTYNPIAINGEIGPKKVRLLVHHFLVV